MRSTYAFKEIINMQLFADGALVYETRYENFNELIQDYRNDELAQGRVVPRYAWEALVLAAGGWLLKKVGDELFKKLMDLLKQRKSAKTASSTLPDDPLLTTFEHVQATNPSQSVTGSDLIQKLLAQKSVKLEIRLTTEAEADLASGLQQLQAQYPGLIVTVQPPDLSKPD
jgi:hypothetical protein